ncbi:hypothetical protein HYX12_02810 [Candidatus Woesearchaeota archaeon]|nr:hypothetical protein [Candidatus Woesearchaeota archaeon]
MDEKASIELGRKQLGRYWLEQYRRERDLLQPAEDQAFRDNGTYDYLDRLVETEVDSKKQKNWLIQTGHNIGELVREIATPAAIGGIVGYFASGGDYESAGTGAAYGAMVGTFSKVLEQLLKTGALRLGKFSREIVEENEKTRITLMTKELITEL